MSDLHQCPDCEGTGLLHADEAGKAPSCPRCNGTGYVPAKSRAELIEAGADALLHKRWPTARTLATAEAVLIAAGCISEEADDE